MNQEQKETVILVHGTWAEPRPDDPAAKELWYYPNSPFCKALDSALQTFGSSARCWAHLTEEHSSKTGIFEKFYWRGMNDFASRDSGATKLLAEIETLKKHGWVCHIVAHSHGGNLLCDIFDQLPQHRSEHAYEPSGQGKYVTLGTPFLHTKPLEPFAVKNRTSTADRFGVRILLVLAFLIVIKFNVSTIFPAAFFTWENIRWLLLAIIGIPVGFGLVSWAINRLRNAFRLWDDEGDGDLNREITFEHLLVINSEYDEALMLLSGLASKTNPLLTFLKSKNSDASHPQSSLLARLKRSWFNLRQFHNLSWKYISARDRFIFHIDDGADDGIGYRSTLAGCSLIFALSALRANDLVDENVWALTLAILIPAVFYLFLFKSEKAYAAIALPYRIVAKCAHYLASWVAHACEALLIRIGPSVIWTESKLHGFGLAYSPHGISDVQVSQKPINWFDFSFVQERLPTRIVTEVLRNRGLFLASHIDTFNMFDIASKFEILRQKVSGFSALPLVHSSYYEEPECIERIARWISQPPYMVEYSWWERDEDRPSDGFGDGEWAVKEATTR